MIWIITICTTLYCQTYAFSTEEQCQAYATTQIQTQPLDCTPMLLWERKDNGTQTKEKNT